MLIYLPVSRLDSQRANSRRNLIRAIDVRTRFVWFIEKEKKKCGGRVTTVRLRGNRERIQKVIVRNKGDTLLHLVENK